MKSSLFFRHIHNVYYSMAHMQIVFHLTYLSPPRITGKEIWLLLVLSQRDVKPLPTWAVRLALRDIKAHSHVRSDWGVKSYTSQRVSSFEFIVRKATDNQSIIYLKCLSELKIKKIWPKVYIYADKRIQTRTNYQCGLIQSSN